MGLQEGTGYDAPAQDSGRVNEGRLALRLAAFCLEMQSGDGLIDKNPCFILAKWGRISQCDTAEQLLADMIPNERVLFQKWRDAWVKE